MIWLSVSKLPPTRSDGGAYMSGVAVATAERLLVVCEPERVDELPEGGMLELLD